jgi:hypothetical protein
MPPAGVLSTGKNNNNQKVGVDWGSPTTFLSTFGALYNQKPNRDRSRKPVTFDETWPN